MAELRIATLERAAAPVAGVSPLPLLELLPYQAQDDYARDRVSQELRVAVLANDRLRATVALDFGGRVLSLVDVTTGCELLYDNPVLQPANLALRNAWFSGGIEWNIGTRGHSPTTMSTLHAGRVEASDGTPVLRLWEWERFREVVFQVDLSLPDGSPVLLAHIRIHNPNPSSRPMYWWTNIAVMAGPETRVVAPATRAVRTEYPDRLREVTVPGEHGGDDTDVGAHHFAADFFYDLAPGERGWISTVEPAGSGLAQIGTAELRGRKMFVWGTGPGGERWQQWLSDGSDARYAEIQAGLAPTQFDHAEMPAGATWEWTEAFGPVQLDPALSRSTDWPTAIRHVGSAIADLAADLDQRHAAACATADRPIDETYAVGSGWGALERRRRVDAGEAWINEAATPFADASLTTEQGPWLTLLDEGALPDTPALSYVRGSDWVRRLAAAPATWLSEYQQATIAHAAGDLDAAVGHYEASIGHRANPWAQRGLAEVARAQGRTTDAARHAVDASRADPADWRLATEAVARLLDDGRPGEALSFIDGLAPSVRARGRTRLLEGFAAVASGALERAASILASGLEVPDLREGERSIDQLWAAVHPGTPVPWEFDFRML